MCTEVVFIHATFFLKKKKKTQKTLTTWSLNAQHTFQYSPILLVSFTPVHISHVHNVPGQVYREGWLPDKEIILEKWPDTRFKKKKKKKQSHKYSWSVTEALQSFIHERIQMNKIQQEKILHPSNLYAIHLRFSSNTTYSCQLLGHLSLVLFDRRDPQTSLTSCPVFPLLLPPQNWLLCTSVSVIASLQKVCF